jgi:CMP/dCMP kinase
MSASLEVVAIDGPSGSGKSTLAKGLAQRLCWRHLNTGAMYRAVTLAFLQARVDLEDPAQVKGVLATLDLRMDAQEHVYLGSEDISQEIRGPAVEALVSAVSAIPAVRDKLVDLQRIEARSGPLVAEGRDMTSVVFPDARWRFYLDASVEERAQRRKGDFDAAGREEDLGVVAEDLRRRDAFDSGREHSPLKLVEGVERIDSTRMDAEAVLAFVLAKVQGRARGMAQGDSI